jgi:hypothetical protein
VQTRRIVAQRVAAGAAAARLIGMKTGCAQVEATGWLRITRECTSLLQLLLRVLLLLLLLLLMLQVTELLMIVKMLAGYRRGRVRYCRCYAAIRGRKLDRRLTHAAQSVGD